MVAFSGKYKMSMKISDIVVLLLKSRAMMDIAERMEKSVIDQSH
jgi:hypothetical protein